MAIIMALMLIGEVMIYFSDMMKAPYLAKYGLEAIHYPAAVGWACLEWLGVALVVMSIVGFASLLINYMRSKEI